MVTALEFVDHRLAVDDEFLDQSTEQAILARVVVIQRRDRHPGSGCDLADRRRREPFGQEKCQCFAEETTGSVSVSGNNFTLVSGNAIPNGSGLFYYGPNMIQTPFGDGVRCVGGATRRLFPVLQADGMGTATRTVDFTVAPANAGTHMITAGSTWNFQHWFRDGMAGMSGFNLSNGLSVTFTP